MPNITTDQINQIRSLFDQGKDILIAIPKSPSLDSVGAALSLYLSISSHGKNAVVVCPNPMLVEFSHLVAVDKVKNTLNGNRGKNLVVSFPYQEGSIEKVSYNIENDLFNLVIEPREGYPSITPEVIQYSNSGGTTDFIITIGVAKLADLDNIYTGNQALYTEKAIINIDSNPQNTRYGKVNIVDPSISSISEIVISLLSHLGFNIDADIATNLLAGISTGSQNFSSKETTANTFEAAAICLRSGARKTTPTSYQTFVPQQPQFDSKAFFKGSKPNFPSQTALPSYPKTPVTNTPFSRPKPIKQPQQSQQQPQKQSEGKETPPDWLKPKIYKGSTLL